MEALVALGHELRNWEDRPLFKGTLSIHVVLRVHDARGTAESCVGPSES